MDHGPNEPDSPEEHPGTDIVDPLMASDTNQTELFRMMLI